MNQTNKAILVGSDHAGFEMKEAVVAHLKESGIPFVDLGAQSMDPQDDYPLFAARVASKISSGEYERGIVLCGTGIGASIAANRFKKVRAALCITPEYAKMARLHNNANVLVLGGRTVSAEVNMKIVDTFLEGTFEGGRHSRRVDQLDNLSC